MLSTEDGLPEKPGQLRFGKVRQLRCGITFRILVDGKIGKAYNVGSGEEKRNIDVVRSILKLLGKPEGLMEFIKDRLGHDFRYSLNSEKARKQFGWGPSIDFDDGIKETVRWYLDGMTRVNGKAQSLRKLDVGRIV